jgi:hypothetical protein
VNDADTAYVAASAFEQEIRKFLLGLDTGEAVQVQFRLGYPLTTAKAPQDLPAETGSNIGMVIARRRLLIPPQGVREGFMYDCPFIPQAAEGEGGQFGRGMKKPPMGGDGFRVGQGGSEQLQIRLAKGRGVGLPGLAHDGTMAV